MKRRKRVCAAFGVLLLLCFAFVSLFASVCASEHTCFGEDCPICSCLTAVRALLRQGETLPILFAVWIGLASAVMELRRLFTDAYISPSPVRMKVKLLN